MSGKVGGARPGSGRKPDLLKMPLKKLLLEWEKFGPLSEIAETLRLKALGGYVCCRKCKVEAVCPKCGKPVHDFAKADTSAGQFLIDHGIGKAPSSLNVDVRMTIAIDQRLALLEDARTIDGEFRVLADDALGLMPGAVTSVEQDAQLSDESTNDHEQNVQSGESELCTPPVLAK